MRWKILGVLLLTGGAFWLGRRSVTAPEAGLLPLSPHEAYGRALAASPFGDAALVRLWNGAARRALADAPLVAAPFREEGYLDPAHPEAVAYRVHALLGQRLALEVTLDPPTDMLVFVDLFRADPDEAPVRVASADSGAFILEYEPGRVGDYIVRIQPELLRGGHYTLTARTLPTMGFPVAGRGRDAVRSFFGDARDGGRRRHHGIDIFAPRGTPVVAAVAGRVSGVRTTEMGGRVVWVRDDATRQSLYYAHLEEQLVRPGERVRPGDTLGLVGNSGNARSTPTHLHFGIYRRGAGPLDPLPFVDPGLSPPALPAPVDGLGTWRRSTAAASLRSAPDTGAPVIARLEEDVPVRTEAVTGEWLRVRLPDGRRGFLAARLTEAPRPLRTEEATAPRSLRDRPDARGAEVSRLEPGETVEVLGRFHDHLYVRAGDREAWLAIAPRE